MNEKRRPAGGRRRNKTRDDQCASDRSSDFAISFSASISGIPFTIATSETIRYLARSYIFFSRNERLFFFDTSLRFLRTSATSSRRPVFIFSRFSRYRPFQSVWLFGPFSSRRPISPLISFGWYRRRRPTRSVLRIGTIRRELFASRRRW